VVRIDVLSVDGSVQPARATRQLSVTSRAETVRE
jgi:hypothetical protein